MKKYFTIFITIAIISGVFLISRRAENKKQAELFGNLETHTLAQGTLYSTIGATGVIRSNQSAVFYWGTSGQVGEVNVNLGDSVTLGESLASLEITSVPSYIILAQADLVSAQNALDDLLHTQSQQAVALKAVDEAEKALDDALHPETMQALALAEIARAEASVEDSERKYKILTAPIPQSAIQQSYANLLLAEDQLNTTNEEVASLEQRIKTAGYGLPPEFKAAIRKALRKALDAMRIKQTQDQLAYERSLNRYNQLFEPPDPVDVAIAEAEMATAQAELEAAQREWERIKDGVSPAEIAVLEARLGDALREWNRVKDGPSDDDIQILEAQIAATQATLQQMNLVAPFDGVVTSVKAQPGDQVDIGDFGFQIDDISRLFVDLEVSEIDINQIKVGQTAILTFDSVFAEEYQGEVVEVAVVGTEILGVVNFNVRVEILEPDEKIKPGMTAAADIITSQVDNALLVPNRAIRIVDGERVVYVLRDEIIPEGDASGNGRTLQTRASSLSSKIEIVPIQIGATANFYSEIIGGDIYPGDTILLALPEEAANALGQRRSGILAEVHP